MTDFGLCRIRCGISLSRGRQFTTAQHVCNGLEAAGQKRSLRSVQRLLDQLCDAFPLEQDTRSKPYGYRWAKDAQGFRLAALTPSEALLLQIASVHAHDFLPSRITKELDDLFASAKKTIDNKPANNADKRWLKKVRRIPSNQPLLAPHIRADIFEAVSEALYYEQKLAVVYENAKGELREAVVHPLGMALQEPRLYVVCRFEGYDNERILSLSRIKKAKVTGEGFVYPKHFDLEKYDGEGRFSFGEGKQVRLSFQIEKMAGRYLTESPLSLDQQVEETDTHLRITATVTDSMLLHAWLRGLGEAVSKVVIKRPS